MARRSIEGAAGIFVCKRIRHWATNTHGTVRPPKSADFAMGSSAPLW
jgi:hypothetical protein